jgi:hypothetical protein
MCTETLLDFPKNNPAIDPMNYANTHELDAKTRVSDAHSKPESPNCLKEKTNKDQHSFEAVDWISGVGDVCNGVTKNRVLRTKSRHWEHLNHAQQISPKETQTLKIHGSNTRSRSALQRHCDFWDADHDGLIYPWDIYIGFRKLGFNMILCIWAAVTMAICSSYSTQTSWMPHPMFAINIDNIHRSRHGSTTATYDMDAEIDMRRFNAIFDKYAEGKDYLTWRSLYGIWAGQCCANDWFGWFAGGLECKYSCNYPLHNIDL